MRKKRRKSRPNKRQNKRSNKRQDFRQKLKIGMGILLGIVCILGVLKIVNPEFFAFTESKEYRENTGDIIEDNRPDIDVQLLTVNPYSRPGIATEKITGIVIHYTANPESTAMQNRDYFEGLQETQAVQASSHFIIGLEGEIVQSIPTWEIAYASNDRNINTVSIECCHPDETGAFAEATYASMVELTAWLCLKFDLDEKALLRHYDITQKSCPKYFVDNEEAWETFKSDVKAELEIMQNYANN
jgi:N-acetylmuramoyl-L-alanine amidase